MATTLKPLYGSHTAMTITSLNSLANGAAAGSAAVDNSADLSDDALVSVVIASNASAGTSATGTVGVYAYGDTDATPRYTDGVSGADATQTPTVPTNLKPIGYGNVVANNTTYRIGPFPVAGAFGGRMPRRWGIVVVNNSGATLAASGNSASRMPLQDQGA